MLAFVVRVIYVLSTPGFAPQHDAHHYDLDAIYIANTDHYPPIFAPDGTSMANAYRPPAYSFMLAGIYKLNYVLSDLGLSRWTAARLAQAVLGALAVAALALIARRLFDRRVSVVTAVLAAVFPSMVFVSESMYSESLFVPLVIFATAGVVEFRTRRQTWILIGAGVVTGIAALTRENGVLLLLPFCIALRPRGKWSLKTMTPAIILVACTLLVVVPWTVRNAFTLHTFVPVSTSTGNTLAGTYNDVSRTAKHYPAAWREPSKIKQFRSIYAIPHLSQAQLNTKLESAAFDYIGQHPTYPFVVAYWNTVRMLELGGLSRSESTAHYIGVPKGDTKVGDVFLWLVLLLSIAACFTQRVRAGEKWLWLVPGIMYIGVVFVQSEAPRFRSPVDPFLAILASISLVVMSERSVAAFRRRRRGLPGADGTA